MKKRGKQREKERGEGERSQEKRGASKRAREKGRGGVEGITETKEGKGSVQGRKKRGKQAGVEEG